MKMTKLHLKKICSVFVLSASIFVFSSTTIRAQETVDKTVATVSDGFDTELITYSDLLWQLALAPNASLNPPTSEDLNRALQILINQRLFALEAERLPRATPNEDDVKKEINRVLALFPSTAEFEKRLRLVGFDSVKDDNFERMMAQRVSIEKYLDFRFRSFVVITSEDEAKYYREVFTPDFRRRNPGLLMPSLDERRAQINRILTEQKVAADIEKFLDDAKRRTEIVVLSEV
ncbi:MAG TPA: hypothetical protein VNI84_20220 [Pyrinomonadaceae bacterium]|nr:hypothetical protein [Pyrinomonadaceae bacterium]